MTTEINIQRKIMLAASEAGFVVFRNNQGVGVVGSNTVFPSKTVGLTLYPGDAVVRRARYVRYGVCNPGGSDLIGYKPVTITPDMVGQTVAVFTAVEAKSATGRATKKQKNFLRRVQSDCGIAIIARSPEDLP